MMYIISICLSELLLIKYLNLMSLTFINVCKGGNSSTGFYIFKTKCLSKSKRLSVALRIDFCDKCDGQRFLP